VRLPSIVCAATLAAIFAGPPHTADASQITYEFSSTASGTIGNTSFTNALVTLTGIGDTADVVSVFGFAAAAPLNLTTIAIQGVGTATITDPTEILSTKDPVSIEGSPLLPFVILGRIDSPPALDSLTGIGFIADQALLGYDLTTSIGPITSVGGIGFIKNCGQGGNDPCLATTMGRLSFASNFGPDDSPVGTFSATLHPVPEPGSLLLVGGGVAALVRRRLRRRP